MLIRSRKAFTLLELMVAFIIMAILSAIAVPSLLGVVNGDQLTADSTSATAIVDAAYYNAQSEYGQADATVTFPITAAEAESFIPAGTRSEIYSIIAGEYGDPTASLQFTFTDGNIIYTADPQGVGDGSPSALGGTALNGAVIGGGSNGHGGNASAPGAGLSSPGAPVYPGGSAPGSGDTGGGSGTTTTTTSGGGSDVGPTIATATITGTPDVGDTLTAVSSGVTGTPTPTETYQWYSNDQAVAAPAGTGQTYVLQTSDGNNYVFVDIIETNSAGSTVLNSNEVLVTPAPAISPISCSSSIDPSTISGPYSEGNWVASAENGTIYNPGTTFTFACSNISAAAGLVFVEQGPDGGVLVYMAESAGWDFAPTGTPEPSLDSSFNINYSSFITASTASDPGAVGLEGVLWYPSLTAVATDYDVWDWTTNSAATINYGDVLTTVGGAWTDLGSGGTSGTSF